MQQELQRGETLLWAGQPHKGILFRTADAMLIPFSIMWAAFAIYWESSVISMGAPFFYMLWGIPFVLVGIYIVFGRFILDAKQRDTTYYGVTNERVIIISGLLSRKTKSLNLRTLTDVSMDEKSNGGGTITFGPGNPMAWWGRSLPWPGMGQHMPPAFELNSGVRDVYAIIRDAQRSSGISASG